VVVDVAITATSDAATAVGKLSPKASTSAGTIITPPPISVMAPSVPEMTPRKAMATSSKRVRCTAT